MNGGAGPDNGSAGSGERGVVDHLVGKVEEAELDDAQHDHEEKRYDQDELDEGLTL